MLAGSVDVVAVVSGEVVVVVDSVEEASMVCKVVEALVGVAVDASVLAGN